jgi:putative toxin-antitoxin system antitoxin component (TIGR02293 family)
MKKAVTKRITPGPSHGAKVHGRQAAKRLSFKNIVSRPLNPATQIETIRIGIPASSIDEAVSYIDISQKDLLAALRIPMSTFHRRLAANETLSPSESEKVVRLGEIARRAEETFGNARAAREWLTIENLALGGTPLSLIDTEAGAAQVRRVLNNLDYGGVA